MKLTTINCIICGAVSLLKHHSQVTCGKLACRQEVKRRWKKKNLDYQKECLCCGVPFKTTHAAKRYCSKECAEKIRKIRSKMGATHWARKKNGTYDKYAMILREVGYTVIAPSGGVR